MTVRDLEARERDLRARVAEAERRDRVVRVFLSIVLLAVLGVAALSWRSLRSDLQSADSNLDVVRITTEEQLTEVLRYAPFTGGVHGKAHQELDAARVNMASPDPSRRVQGILAARAITRRRFPAADARVHRELVDLHDVFRNRNREWETVIQRRAHGYRKAANSYNGSVTAFPGNLVHHLFGMPAKLPTIQP